MGKKTIKIREWTTNRIFFTYTCENNTIKKTVEEAVRRKVSFYCADLSCFNLSGADLRNVDLSWAKLDHTILSDANLSGADLKFADLRSVILSNTNLLGADLYSANLCETVLSDTKIDYPMDIPEGEFIAWKKVYDFKKNALVIIKLKILEDSKRSRATTNKCRCNKALALEIQNSDGSKSDLLEVVSDDYTPCTYKVGEIVEADSWDENRFNECSHGIHFFLDREHAVDYLKFHYLPF